MRSSLHDLANTLSGIRGILELSDPLRPLSPRDRNRLEAILAEGMTTLDRARYLAMGSLPDAVHEQGEDWRRTLLERFQPLAVIFKCQVQARYEGDPAQDRWPGELLRGYVLAVSRQILPYVSTPPLALLCAADTREWRIRWEPAPNLPESLKMEQDLRPRDISARWALRVGGSLGIQLEASEGSLLARIPRF